MPVTDRLVLPPDVAVVPVSDLPAAVRSQLDPAEGDYAVTRPRTRAGAKLVSASVAEMVRLFRTPTRVVDAVLTYSRSHGLNPRDTLIGAFPAIRDCYNARLLVSEQSPLATSIAPSLARDAAVGRFRVIRPVQVLEDVELYLVKDAHGEPAALKLLRPGSGRAARRGLEREAAALVRLAGHASPALIERGAWENDPYLVMSWSAGASPLVVAGELRDRGLAGRRDLLALCLTVADAYAALHARGVIHGDVHPGNLLIAPDGTAVVLDFGLARVAGEGDDAVPRGAVAQFMDPELAAARVAGTPSPPATALSDQYALAAVLYALLTGEHYARFALEAATQLGQVIAEAPLPFSQRGVAPWPPVEAILRRALAKRPDDRYASVADLSAALRAIPPPALPPAAPAAHTALDDLLAEVRRAAAPDSALFQNGLPVAPFASVTYGAAGIAHALYRIAGRIQDPATLFLADSWVTRAHAGAADPGAFYNAEREVRPEVVGAVSLHHTAPGVHCVRALIALAMSDEYGAGQAIRAYADGWEGDGPLLDLTLGRVGALVGCSLLLDALPDSAGRAAGAVRALGDRTLDLVWRTVASHPSIGSRDAPLITLGMAHGWAGILYASLQWCRSAAVPIPAELPRRLGELAGLAEPDGRGARWPWPVRAADGRVDTHYMPGWCQGSAGFVHLWLRAAQQLRDPAYATLAERAAWHVWEAAAEVPTLCCGLGGRAYALLAWYRVTGEAVWLARARALGERAARHRRGGGVDPDFAMSLYKGDVGLAALAADLAEPEGASMPMFEDEGWPVHRAAPEVA